MSACRYLFGENIKPKTSAEARAMIGMSVRYLTRSDIDRSGRGMFFPLYGVIAAVQRREIAIDSPDNFCLNLGSLVEMEAA